MIWQMTYTHKLPKLCSASLTHPHSQNREFNLINNNREGNSLRHVAMVAKLLDLNKAWSCKYGRKNKTKQKRKNLACMTPVHDCTLDQNGSPYFPSIARQRKWPSLSWQIVEIQKSCYHGNVTSQSSSLRSTASLINWWKKIYKNEFVSSTSPLSLFLSYLVVLASSTLCNVCLSSCRYHNTQNMENLYLSGSQRQ